MPPIQVAPGNIPSPGISCLLAIGAGYGLCGNTLVLAQVINDSVPEKGYETKEVILTGRMRNVEPWVISNLAVGDEMTNGNSDQIVARVLSIATEAAQSQLMFYNPSRFSGNASTGDLVVQRNSRLKDLVIKTRLLVEKHGDEWYFGGHQNIKVGNNLGLYFPKVDLKLIEIEKVQDVEIDENSQQK